MGVVCLRVNNRGGLDVRWVWGAQCCFLQLIVFSFGTRDRLGLPVVPEPEVFLRSVVLL